MGVRYLNNLIGDKCKLALVKRHLSAYAKTTIVVDTSIYIYKFLGENALMERMYLMMAQFKMYNITPIFVFDGNSPQEKRDTLQDREFNRKCAQMKFIRASETVSDIRHRMTLHANSGRPLEVCVASVEADADTVSVTTEVAVSEAEAEEEPRCAISAIIDMESALYDLRKQCVRVRGCELTDVKRLMRAFDMRYIDADGESDNMCAQIVKLGIAHACMSDDMDMLLYDCPRVLRHFNINQETIVEYDLHQILAVLDVTISEFREICVLSGTDYNPHNFDPSIQHRIYLSSIFENYYRFRNTIAENHEPGAFCDWMKNTNWLFRCVDVGALQRVYDIFSVELTKAQLENIADVLRRNEIALAPNDLQLLQHQPQQHQPQQHQPQQHQPQPDAPFEIPARVKRIMAQYNFIYL
jgi:5'-3' exonuclease